MAALLGPRTGATRPATWWRAYLPVAVTAVVLAAVPLVLGGSGYLMSLAATVLIFAAYAIGFNVIFGASGQLFLCMGALAGLAGYTSTILADDRGWPLLLSLSTGVLLATLLGGVFSWVAVRRHLEVIFVGIITLTFSLAFTSLAQGLRTVTGGETGRVVAAGGPVLRDRIASYYLFLAVVVAFLVVFRWIERSHVGWAFRASKDDAVAAELAGIDVARYRILAGAIGSAMIGLAGALFAHHEAFISPTSYAFAHVDVRTLVILALGGIGSLLGPVVGAVAIGIVDEVLRPLGQLRLTIYGGVLIALFLGLRGGLVPAVAAAARAVGRGRRHDDGPRP